MRYYQASGTGEIRHQTLTEYEWLLQNVGHVGTPSYQKKYRRYWAMNVAQLSSSFYSAYFNALDTASTQKPTLSKVVHIMLVRLTPKSTRFGNDFVVP